MSIKYNKGGRKDPVLGLGPAAKRHHLKANHNEKGEPDGTYRCITCIKDGVSAE